MRNMVRIVLAGVLIVGLVGVSVRPIRAATAVRLRYRFAVGTTFTLRVTEDSTLTETLEGKTASSHVRVGALEQGRVARVFPDGSALFRYRFADLRYTVQGRSRALPGGDASAAQWVPDTGLAEGAAPRCLPTTVAGADADFAARPPVPLPTLPVARGDAWEVGTAQPGLDLITGQPSLAEAGRQTLVVRLDDLAAGVATFSARNGGPIRHLAQDETTVGTTALTETLRQAMPSGIPLEQHVTLTGAVTDTLLDTLDGRPQPATFIARATLDVVALPDAAFPAPAASPTPAPSPAGPPAATGPLSPTAALRALNLQPSDVAACAAVYHDHIWVGASGLLWFPSASWGEEREAQRFPF